MKLVRENINEVNFERGLDPKKAMNIGTRQQIIRDLEEAGLKEDDVDIDENIIQPKTSVQWKIDRIRDIQYKYILPEEQRLVMLLHENDTWRKRRNEALSIHQIIDEALEKKIDPKTIEKFIKIWASKEDKTTGNIYLAKKTRSKQKIEEDDEQNIYLFIGYNEKAPIKIKGVNEPIYQDKFMAETIVKIDKYNLEDLNMVDGMKKRASVQYSNENGRVYMIKLPKFVMDEDRYEGIPDEWLDIVIKYKVRI